MGSSVIIRVGGMVAMLGGLAATILALLYVLQAWGMTLDFTAKALLKGSYEAPFANMLLVGVVAAIVALHFIQRRSYGRLGALASASAIGGPAMVVIGFLVSGLDSDSAFFLGIGLLTVGVVVGSTGIVLLGIVTITARVLPRWCGVAIIAGSPPGVAVLFLFIGCLYTQRRSRGVLRTSALTAFSEVRLGACKRWLMFTRSYGIDTMRTTLRGEA